LKDCNVAFLTNGKLLNEEFIKKIKKYPQIKEIKLSLDGFDSHNILRKGSDWRHILKVIKELKRNNLKVVINTEVLGINLNEMPRLYQKLKKLKIDRWRVDIPFSLGRYKNNHLDYILPSSENFLNTFAEIVKDYIRNKPSFEIEIYNLYKSEFHPTNTIWFDINSHPCEYRRGSVPIRPNGDLILCPSMDKKFSNFKENSGLTGALEKKKKDNFFNLKISDLKECINCRYLKICGGGCRVNSIASLDNIKGPDPLACSLFPGWEEIFLEFYDEESKKIFRESINLNGTIPKKYF
jgi:radical SAM protein with 4Fe4S-binding SPASM domain